MHFRGVGAGPPRGGVGGWVYPCLGLSGIRNRPTPPNPQIHGQGGILGGVDFKGFGTPSGEGGRGGGGTPPPTPPPPPRGGGPRPGGPKKGKKSVF